jgi:hypothetical protein
LPDHAWQRDEHEDIRDERDRGVLPRALDLLAIEERCGLEPAEAFARRFDEGIDERRRWRTGSLGRTLQLDRRQQIRCDGLVACPDPACDRRVVGVAATRHEESEDEQPDEQTGDEQAADRQHRDRRHPRPAEHVADERQHDRETERSRQRVQHGPPCFVAVQERAHPTEKPGDQLLRWRRDGHARNRV